MRCAVTVTDRGQYTPTFGRITGGEHPLDALTEFAQSIPRLDGCACRGEYELFDLRLPGDSEREALESRVIQICLNECPALQACTTWLASLPVAARPCGVVAGQVVKPSASPQNPAQNAPRKPPTALLTSQWALPDRQRRRRLARRLELNRPGFAGGSNYWISTRAWSLRWAS